MPVIKDFVAASVYIAKPPSLSSCGKRLSAPFKDAASPARELEMRTRSHA